MKKITFLFLFTILGVAPLWADTNAGFQAYQKGDFQVAYELLLPEARQGNRMAQFALGLLYHGGKGVAKDGVQAYMWYSLAEENGHKEASKNKAEVAAKMTPEEIQKAETLVVEFKKNTAKEPSTVHAEKPTIPKKPAVLRKDGTLSVLGETTQEITGEAGGSVSLANGAKLNLPKGAVVGKSSIHLRRADLPQISGREHCIGGLYSAQSSSRFQVQNRFTLELPYDRNALPSGAIEEELSAVQLIDEKVLIPVTSRVDQSRQVVIVEYPEVNVSGKGTGTLKRNSVAGSTLQLKSGSSSKSVWYTIVKNQAEKEKLSPNFYAHKDHFFRLIFKVKTPMDFAEYASKSLQEALKAHNAAFKSKTGKAPFAHLSTTNRMSVYIGSYSEDGRYKFLSWNGWIEIDLAKGNKDRPDLRNTLFHEVFHAVQDTYRNMYIGGISALWWYEATADWAGHQGVGTSFAKRVKTHLGEYSELLSVPIQKSYSYHGGSLSYGCSLLVHHVEKQKPGHVLNLLQSSEVSSSALYQRMVTDGNLKKTYADFVKEVLTHALPDKEPWCNGWIIERDKQTWGFARPKAAIGSVDQKRFIRKDDKERAAEWGFGGIAAPLTTRFFSVGATKLKEPRELKIKLTEGASASSRAWLVQIPFKGKLSITPLTGGKASIPGLGQKLEAVWVAVYNNDPAKEMRFKLSLQLGKKEEEGSRRAIYKNFIDQGVTKKTTLEIDPATGEGKGVKGECQTYRKDEISFSFPPAGGGVTGLKWIRESQSWIGHPKGQIWAFCNKTREEATLVEGTFEGGDGGGMKIRVKLTTTQTAYPDNVQTKTLFRGGKFKASGVGWLHMGQFKFTYAPF